MLRISNGYSPEYLLKEVATGRENYYTGAVADGEPPGRWWGAGAEKLGLRGLVDAGDMRAVYERFLDPRADGFSDPRRWAEVPTLGHTGRAYKSEDQLYDEAIEREPDASPERRAELRVEAGKKARRNVAFYDATFSVQKSVTLLHTAFEAKEVAARTAGDEETAAAWGRFREAVEDAIWAGNNAGLTYLQDKAGYTRIGHHGGAAGRHADAHDWTVASFFQHDSRERDPQLHIHNTILNRVEGPDGAWRTLDGRSLHRWRAAGAAVAERTTEERITSALGMVLATRPDGKAREVVGVPAEAMALISTRRHKLTAKAAELASAFEARHGRAPTSYERERINQAATLATRKAKTHDGETRTQLLDRIDARIRAEVAGGLAGVADAALAARHSGPAAPAAQAWSPTAVMETALADVQARKSTWTRADLAAAINAALPDHLGLADGAGVAELLDGLTDRALTFATPMDAARPGEDALPAALRLANGESVYQQPGARLYATPDHVKIEQLLTAAATQSGGTALPLHIANRFLTELAEQGISLGADQGAAIRGVLTSGARMETLVGPAGTGKSFVVGALARAWTDPDLAPDLVDAPPRRVFGLATSQVATNVLAGEGLQARNVARWLATQDRLAAPVAEGQAVPQDGLWRLHAGDLVVVDESAMTDTNALAAIHRYGDAAGAKLLLVGDHRQLAAVGAGGGMDLLAKSGPRYELTDARRFTESWEREASLRLRAGDETVLRDYHRHGRLLDSGTATQAEQSAARAWLADTLAGRRSLLLVDTNDQAARLSAELRAELVRLGRVQEDGVVLGLDGTTAGVGDLVQARRNDWHLAGHDGNRRGPINRETYEITAIRPNGSLEVATTTTRDDADGAGGVRMVLPPEYVSHHLALGYATTVHAAQGTTVDTAHTVVTTRTGPAALYVGMSRGRDANTAHVVTVSAVEDTAHGREDQTVHRDPIAALAGLLDPDEISGARSALATAAQSAAEAEAVRTPAELLTDAAQLAATERTATWLDELAADGTLSISERTRIAAEDGAASLTRVLRRAELAGRDACQVLHDAIADRPLAGARNVTNVVHARITEHDRFDPRGDSWADWIPQVADPHWQAYLDRLAVAADERTAELGANAAEAPPAWAIETFGPPPLDEAELRTWQDQVGTVAGYRELSGHESDTDVLGPAPAPGQTEAFAAYRAAWRTLGRPEIDREEQELSNGQLHVRVRSANREEAWGPRYVANELAGTRQAAAHQRQTAALRSAEATAAHDPAEQFRLAGEARDADALACLLDQQATALEDLEDARSEWLVHTAETRARGERAKAELALRHANDLEPEPQVTAEEWLAADAAARAEDDPHREIAEHDLYRDDQNHLGADDHRDNAADAGIEPDVREIAAGEPAPVDEDVVRVPTASETADALDVARRALAEITARQALDEAEAAAQRADELHRWRTQDYDYTAEVEDSRSDESVTDDADF
ncbi:MobF family relaxase [Pseudonocardia sp. WMMC193]|uniref:MobF family relaxase n=1 Tax=Pseudonocardia sp. WMMC193 TaxID=2911965 RepID=UPI001F1647C8|nr:MobF family relaxase [Pseudonocardia sp. WMMC193]MCF7547426.1 relaxase domain-containing protein [Pseudonocardia sp. WMMC193]